MKVQLDRNARLSALPFGQKLGYAAGGLVDGTALHPLNIFLLFYVTSVCGLSGGLAGLAIAAGLVVDAIADPLIGSASDRLHSRLGRRLPFMLAATPLVALMLTFIFSLPDTLGTMGLFVWFATLSIGLRVSVALFLLPHQALGAELSDDYRERSQIMAVRWSLFMAGGIAGVALGFGVFFSGPKGLSDREAYAGFALALSAIVILGGSIASRAAWLTRAREHAPPINPVAGRFNVFADMAEVFRSGSFRVLFTGTLLFFVGFGINSVLGLHVNTFFWRLSTGQVQAVTIALFLGLFLGAPLAGPLLARGEKRTVIRGAIAALLVLQGAPILLRLAGLLPLEGAALAITLTVISLTIGALMGVAGISSASALADAADEHELLFGSRREGLYFAGFAFANKAASAAGTLLAGLVLQAVAFPIGTGGHGPAIAQVTDHMSIVLALAYGPGAAIVSLAAVAINGLYRIDRARHSSIIAQLAARRTGTAERMPPTNKGERSPGA
ncbi:MFS transporter [Sphingomonas sp. MG17]|uniref:MFS transporter n=1 Tax=Sphingomonas tagetis TaxID=2949092 RepID=A0A9X2KMX0_9SPHN|nr:MFS transporter [Sphingomonas tagetis]MCP3732250.1 MFS transporter [Sphingomonas tagetis]